METEAKIILRKLDFRTNRMEKKLNAILEFFGIKLDDEVYGDLFDLTDNSKRSQDKKWPHQVSKDVR